jgi:hypothetical protein
VSEYVQPRDGGKLSLDANFSDVGGITTFLLKQHRHSRMTGRLLTSEI